MIIQEKKTFIGYRCPHCGCGVLGFCGSFALSGGRLYKLKCTCGESHLSITETKEDRLRITLPCLLCNQEHRYIVSERLFYGRDLFLLNCAYSDLDVCFIGSTEEAVSAALEKNEKPLRELFADAGLASLSKMQRNGEAPTLPDAEVLEIIRFLVKDLEEEGRLDCPCHNGDYELTLTEEGVCITCRNCGGRYVCPVGSVEAAQDFLSCDSITLTDPEE